MSIHTKNILQRINLRLGYTAYTNFPRSSTEFVKEIFKDKEITAIEIGVARGCNAHSILKTLNLKRLYLIDNYDRNNQIEYVGMGDWEGESKELLKSYKNKIKFIKLKSYLAKDQFEDNTIDFIYIDGSHLYENVLNDLKDYYPKVKDGGILAGHDIALHQEVTDAVIDFVKDSNLKLIVKHDDWIIIKSKDKVKNG